jgi:hypothetical protein
MSSVVRQRGPAYAVLAMVCLALAAGGALAMREEFSTYLRTGSIVNRAKQITPDMTIGLSTNTMRATLGDCVGTMQRFKSLEMMFEPPETRAGILNNCLATADEIAGRAPSLSLAWFTGAYAAIMLSDIAGFNDRMRRSQLTAPSEQWLADMRVELAETHLSDLDAQTRAAHEEDLKLMVRSAVGLRNVAKRWIRDENFRARIADIVETMPEETQKRFITNLQRAVRNAGR